jgi:hypothetical protein
LRLQSVDGYAVALQLRLELLLDRLEEWGGGERQVGEAGKQGGVRTEDDTTHEAGAC